jgi:hypothetical protein
MAQTLPNNSYNLKQQTSYLRSFFFGTTGQAATMSGGIYRSGAAGFVGLNIGSPAAFTEIGNGWYTVALNGIDTINNGTLAYHITSSGAGGPCDFCDMITATSPINDLNFSNGLIINSNVKQNQDLNGFPFMMINSTTGALQPGLTVLAQRSLSGGGFAACQRAPYELGGGAYAINLAALDLNANTVALRFTATGATELDILLVTQP